MTNACMTLTIAANVLAQAKANVVKRARFTHRHKHTHILKYTSIIYSGRKTNSQSSEEELGFVLLVILFYAGQANVASEDQAERYSYICSLNTTKYRDIILSKYFGM